MDDIYIGTVFVERRCRVREELRGQDGVVAFLKARLFDSGELRITGPHPQRLIFQATDGVDRLSELAHLGVDLRQIYQDLKAEALAKYHDPEAAREAWEVYYDSVGLSPEEISMRQRAKVKAKAARTIVDVVLLLEGTYFDASFETTDGRRRWGYFDPKTMSATPMSRTQDDGWDPSQDEEVKLMPTARVKYIGSGEDLHLFVILDPPE